MSGAWTVAKREFASYFVTPMGYVVVGMFAVLSGLGFRAMFLDYARVSQTPSDYGYASVPEFEEYFLHPFLVFCGMLVVFLGPLITMRLMAEERNRGTAEQLFTLPLRDRDIIFGKFAAALGVLVVMLLPVAVDLGIVFHFRGLEPGVLACGVAAVFLMGAAFLSLGFFVSCLMHTQITAAAITFGLNMLFFFLGNMAEGLPEPQAAASGAGMLHTLQTGAYRVIRGLLRELAADGHLEDLTAGVVRLPDVAYYVLFCAFFLFLSFRALESRHWRA